MVVQIDPASRDVVVQQGSAAVVRVLPPTTGVEIVREGPQGIPGEKGDVGPQGPAGSGGITEEQADARYLMTQGGGTVHGSVTVAHNLTVGNDLGTLFLSSENGADMGDSKVIGVADGTAPTDAVNKGQLDTRWVRWTGTQAAYDAIGTKDPNTLYVITG